MKIQRILIVRTDRVGDVVLTLPLVGVLKHLFPKSFIAFLTRAYTLPLVENCPLVDQIIEYEPAGCHHGRKGHHKLAQTLSAFQFDAALFCFPRWELVLAAKRAGIPHRLGTGFRWYSFLFTQKIYEHRKHCLKHELEYNVALASLLSREKLPPPSYGLHLKESLLRWRDETLQKFGLENGYAIIHAGNGGSAPNLSLTQYRTVRNFLLEHTSWKILLTGSLSEKGKVADLLEEALAKRMVNGAGKFNLEELMAVVSGAKLLISSSTGPLHLADALGVPVAAFYCPRPPSTPKRWGPFTQPQGVLQPHVETPKRCQLKKCPHGGCLTQLSGQQLKDFLQERLRALNGQIRRIEPEERS